MKTSKILITIGLVLSVIAVFLLLASGYMPLMGIILLGAALWFYFKETNVERFSIAFIIIGVVYIILNALSGSISIDGVFYLIGGIIARNGK